MIRVVASGGFDPLHIGHVEYLNRAKKLGDELIVIVNRDEFLRKKKGYIFMSELDRIELIRNLKCVDDAILCVDNDMTVCRTLEMLKPHIFAKGGDRTVSNIPEREVCEKRGIIIIDGLGEKIRSSSEIVEGGKENVR